MGIMPRGNPNPSTKFPKGKSANPAGRPKGAKDSRPRAYKPKFTDRKTALNIMTRMGIDELALKSVLKHLAVGDKEMTIWYLNQVMGTPKSTVENLIGDRELLAAVGRVTAEFIEPGMFQAWALRLNSELSALSNLESTVLNYFAPKPSASTEEFPQEADSLSD